MAVCTALTSARAEAGRSSSVTFVSDADHVRDHSGGARVAEHDDRAGQPTVAVASAPRAPGRSRACSSAASGEHERARAKRDLARDRGATVQTTQETPCRARRSWVTSPSRLLGGKMRTRRSSTMARALVPKRRCVPAAVCSPLRPARRSARPAAAAAARSGECPSRRTTAAGSNPRGRRCASS